MNSGFHVDIRLLREGDKAAFEAVYHEFFGILYALGSQYLLRAEDAEEMVQEAFLKLWEVRSRLDENSNIKNFLYTITKNNCLNFIRNEQIASSHLSRYYDELQYHYEALYLLEDDYAGLEELKLKIDEAIDALPLKWKNIFRMSREEELRYKDISKRLGISEKTVEATITKALKKLREELKEYLIFIGILINMV
ncbi:MAG: RNA polymerase sigma-70 factor [Mangrovibacterium sp.]|nr:RNA polymerase sigma-70 factor [Mangrovibacterium sp.]